MATHRDKIIFEIISTEVTYTNSLDWLLLHFRTPLLHGEIITDKQDQTIFLNTEAILGLHQPLLEKLEAAVAKAKQNDAMATICIGQILLDLIPWLRLYTTYINETMKGSNLIDHLYKTDDNFRYALNGCCADNFSGLMGISSLRQVPVQRVPRYVLLLKDLLKHTTEDHPDYTHLQSALKGFEQIATEINEKKREAENQAKLQRYDEIVKGNRHLLLEDSPDIQKHSWKTVRISSPTTCDNLGCGSVIGFGKKYHKCTSCNIVVHKICAEEVPDNCNQIPSFIKYDRVLIKDGMIRSTRVHMNSGKKTEGSRAVELLLFTDYMTVCCLVEKEIELDAVIRWLSINTGRKISFRASEHDDKTFVVTSPSDGDTHSFHCDTMKDRDDWLVQLTEAEQEWTESYNSRRHSIDKEIINEDETPVFSIAHTVPVCGPKGKTFTAFVIDFKYEGSSFTTLKRYSQFDKFHKQLKGECPKLDIPSLPSKRYFADNNDPNFVKARCHRLETFLNKLVHTHPEVFSLQAFRDFLFGESSDTVMSSKEKTDAPLDSIPEPMSTEERKNQFTSARASTSHRLGPPGTSILGRYRSSKQLVRVPPPVTFLRGVLLTNNHPPFKIDDPVIILRDDGGENWVSYLNGEYISIPKTEIKLDK